VSPGDHVVVDAGADGKLTFARSPVLEAEPV